MYIAAVWVAATIFNLLLIGMLTFWGGKHVNLARWLLRLSLVLTTGTITLVFILAYNTFERQFPFIGTMLVLIGLLACILTYLTHFRWYPNARNQA